MIGINPSKIFEGWTNLWSWSRVKEAVHFAQLSIRNPHAKNSEMACVVAFGCITDVQNNVQCIWFSEMRRHDLTNKKTMTMTKAITITMTMTMTMTNENLTKLVLLASSLLAHLSLEVPGKSFQKSRTIECCLNSKLRTIPRSSYVQSVICLKWAIHLLRLYGEISDKPKN